MAKKRPKKTSQKSVPFEQSLERLKSIVHELEEGNLSLDDSLEKYESGIRHLKSCYRSLKNAEQKIGLLVGLDQQGRAKTEEFDDLATYPDAEVQDELREELDDEVSEIDDSDRLF